jgi:ABC-type antimicrobial peptide transport system permease subunit
MLEFRTISPGFAQAMGMRLMKGRLIDEQDSQFSPAVAMVNESFVSRYSPDQSVLERTILIQDGVSSRPRRIVGVVNNVKNTSMSVEAKAEAYVPYVERPYANMSIVVRTRTPAQSLSNSVRRVLAKLDPRIPLANVRSLNEFVLSATSLERFRAFLMSAFSFCALLLSAVGIYGVTSYSMSRRRVEFGVRIALGAHRWDIMILVLSWATRLAAYGVIVGVVLAMGAAQIVRRLLYQVSSFDFWTYSAVAIVLAGIALLASLVPAFRAAKISPASTLRC